MNSLEHAIFDMEHEMWKAASNRDKLEWLYKWREQCEDEYMHKND